MTFKIYQIFKIKKIMDCMRENFSLKNPDFKTSMIQKKRSRKSLRRRSKRR